MAAAIFITGTDTGVGKTLFACALAAYLKTGGYSVGVMKPAETGCIERDGELFPDDAHRLKQASGSNQSLDKICPYRFSEPLAPSIAASRAGIKIDIDYLLECFGEIRSTYDVTLVEGAGGLMVPLLPSYTFADFARVAQLPMIVVAANKLGVINHLLLTLEHASCTGLRTIGYVLNQVESELSLAAQTNREVLLSLTGVPCLGELPHVENTNCEPAALANWVEENCDMDLLLRPLLP